MNIFVAISSYQRPLEEIDRYRADHLDWIGSQYRAGRVLVSGRREAAVGGVIIARAHSVEDMSDFLRGDPFVQNELASYEVTEFQPTPAALATPGYSTFNASPMTESTQS